MFFSNPFYLFSRLIECFGDDVLFSNPFDLFSRLVGGFGGFKDVIFMQPGTTEFLYYEDGSGGEEVSESSSEDEKESDNNDFVDK